MTKFLAITYLSFGFVFPSLFLYFFIWSFRQKTFRSLPWLATYVLINFIATIITARLGVDHLVNKSLENFILMLGNHADLSFGALSLYLGVIFHIVSQSTKLVLWIMIAIEVAHHYLSINDKIKDRIASLLAKMYSKIPILGSFLILIACSELFFSIYLFLHAYKK